MEGFIETLEKVPSNIKGSQSYLEVKGKRLQFSTSS